MIQARHIEAPSSLLGLGLKLVCQQPETWATTVTKPQEDPGLSLQFSLVTGKAHVNSNKNGITATAVDRRVSPKHWGHDTPRTSQKRIPLVISARASPCHQIFASRRHSR